jgi:hypothetical protein
LGARFGKRAVNINVIYGEGAANDAAPSGFYTALNYVVNYFDQLFTNNVTLNINFSYGAILDPATGSYSSVGVGESCASADTPLSYDTVVSALQAENAPGCSSLPVSSPISGTLWMGSAEAKALGLDGASSALDGAVGVGSNVSWDFAPNTTPASNQYYLVGVLEHEITELMGRISFLGSPGQYGVADLYRYSAPGVRSDAPGGSNSTAYFSVDNGNTNLGAWNNQVSNGDLADWYPQGPAPGGNDAFNDYCSPGVISVISSFDRTLMEALGWTVASSPSASPSPVQGPYTIADVNGWFQTIDGLPATTTTIPSTLSITYVDELNTNTATPAQIQADLQNPAVLYRTSIADFVLREFQAAWDAVPTSAQYDAWVARVIADPTLESGGISQALAATPQFQAQYGVTGTTIAMLTTVETFALDLLGIQPANLGPGALSLVGLPVWEVLQNFVQSPRFIAHTAGPIVTFQNALLEPTPVPSSQAPAVGSDAVQLTGTVSLESLAGHHLYPA